MHDRDELHRVQFNIKQMGGSGTSEYRCTAYMIMKCITGSPVQFTAESRVHFESLAYRHTPRIHVYVYTYTCICIYVSRGEGNISGNISGEAVSLSHI